MAHLYYDTDADLAALAGTPIAVIGFGSQGHAHALNLRDAGLDVRVGLYAGSPSAARARDAGLRVCTVGEAVREAGLVALLTPDTGQAALYEEEIAPFLAAGTTLLFAHGFAVRFRTIPPPPGVDVIMVAPKAPGHRVREVYAAGGGVPGLVAVAQDASGRGLATALAYAKGIGCTRAGVLRTTFDEETETDLFGEQAVLCGGVSALIKAGFETLVEAGYQPEVAYFECLHELKLIVDLVQQGGLSYMRYSVSDTAEWGDYVAGPRIVTEETRAAMRALLGEVRSGAFAERWIAENRTGRAAFERLRAADVDHPIERVGRELRRRMPFIDPKEIAPGTAAPRGAEPALAS